jgi:drug/metabolite transporter (DMT)-like permease
MGQYQQKSVWLFVHSMLIALTPVILLPISYFVFHEKIGWQAILGTVLAIAGVAILFLA